jgi:hypothetical protein
MRVVHGQWVIVTHACINECRYTREWVMGEMYRGWVMGGDACMTDAKYMHRFYLEIVIAYLKLVIA